MANSAHDFASFNRLDLRFVPDGQSFEGRRVRDSAADVPAGYEAPPAFATAALQHTSVKLTWDAGRHRTEARAVQARDRGGAARGRLQGTLLLPCHIHYLHQKMHQRGLLMKLLPILPGPWQLLAHAVHG